MLSLVGLLGGLGGFAWCFPWWLCDVVVVGCVVDGGSMGDGAVDDGLVGGD